MTVRIKAQKTKHIIRVSQKIMKPDYTTPNTNLIKKKRLRDFNDYDIFNDYDFSTITIFCQTQHKYINMVVHNYSSVNSNL